MSVGITSRLLPAVRIRAVLWLKSVSYLFRTTGQVLGVSLSGALTQAILAKELGERITGEGAEEVSCPDYKTGFELTVSDNYLYSTIIHFDPASRSASPRCRCHLIPKSLTRRVHGLYRPCSRCRSGGSRN